MENNNYRPMSIGDWIVTWILMAIPIVNFVLLLVWAFSTNTQPSKKSWAQASLIFLLIIIVFYIIVAGIILSNL